MVIATDFEPSAQAYAILDNSVAVNGPIIPNGTNP